MLRHYADKIPNTNFASRARYHSSHLSGAIHLFPIKDTHGDLNGTDY